MKPVIRLFFKTVRAIVGPVMLVGHRVTRPKGVIRAPTAQQAVDARTAQMALYHFPTCPFCLKARRAMQRLSLNIELRNAQHDPAHRQALLAGGSKIQTPCLRITDAQGQSTWLYESRDIIAYLERELGGL